MDSEAFEKLAGLRPSEVGRTEENVKNSIVVPLLDALGHGSHLDFEKRTDSGFIDILVKNVPSDCRMVIEVKNFGVELGAHSRQLETYCRETGALLGVLTNGEDFWVYSPFWRGRRFERQVVLAFKLNELPRHIDILQALMSRDALVSKSARRALEQKEVEVENGEKKAEEISKEYASRIQVLEMEMKSKIAEIERLRNERDSKLTPIESMLGMQQPKRFPAEEVSLSGQYGTLSMANKYVKLLEALSKGPRSGVELTAECGFENRMKCAGPLAVLTKQKAVVEISRGKYQITDVGRKALETRVMPKFNA